MCAQMCTNKSTPYTTHMHGNWLARLSSYNVYTRKMTPKCLPFSHKGQMGVWRSQVGLMNRRTRIKVYARTRIVHKCTCTRIIVRRQTKIADFSAVSKKRSIFAVLRKTLHLKPCPRPLVSLFGLLVAWGRHRQTDTHTHTDKPSTITLAAHARRGLIRTLFCPSGVHTRGAHIIYLYCQRGPWCQVASDQGPGPELPPPPHSPSAQHQQNINRTSTEHQQSRVREYNFYSMHHSISAKHLE